MNDFLTTVRFFTLAKLTTEKKNQPQPQFIKTEIYF